MVIADKKKKKKDNGNLAAIILVVDIGDRIWLDTSSFPEYI